MVSEQLASTQLCKVNILYKRQPPDFEEWIGLNFYFHLTLKAAADDFEMYQNIGNIIEREKYHLFLIWREDGGGHIFINIAMKLDVVRLHIGFEYCTILLSWSSQKYGVYFRNKKGVF